MSMSGRTNQVMVDLAGLWTLLYLLVFVVFVYWFFSTMRRIEHLLEEIRDRLDSGKT